MMSDFKIGIITDIDRMGSALYPGILSDHGLSQDYIFNDGILLYYRVLDHAPQDTAACFNRGMGANHR
jgi:hypothetical protein